MGDSLKKLYPEQQEARHISNTFLNSKTGSVFVSPCGTGKTFTSTTVISDRINLGETIFVLVPQLEIFDVWMEELSEMGLNPGYINDEGMKGKNRDVYVCMFQSLINILPLIHQSNYPNTIIVDEFQHMLASSIKDICSFFDKAIILGLTATLYHNSGETFRPWVTESFQTITKKMAIEKGYITEPLLIEPENYLKDFDIPEIDDDYDMKKQVALLGKTVIYGDMIRDYELLFNGRPVIIPCGTYEQSASIKKMFNEKGWNFEHVHSSGMPKHERKRILRGIEDQSIHGLCTVGIGVEGMSIKGLWGVMWACRTESPIRWTQFNGRGERLYPGKRFCIVVDYVGNAIIHGHPSNERKWDLDGKELELDEEDNTPFIKCPDCGVFNSIENTNCHWCNADLTDEGKKEGTCRRCKNWKKGECTKSDMLKACTMWLQFEGCPSFTRRGRSLPAVVDGNLVAINTAGEVFELKKRTDQKKQEIKTKMDEEKQERESLETIDSFEKRKIIRKGLFMDNNRRSLFVEALEG